MGKIIIAPVKIPIHFSILIFSWDTLGMRLHLNNFY